MRNLLFRVVAAEVGVQASHGNRTLLSIELTSIRRIVEENEGCWNGACNCCHTLDDEEPGLCQHTVRCSKSQDLVPLPSSNPVGALEAIDDSTSDDSAEGP